MNAPETESFSARMKAARAAKAAKVAALGMTPQEIFDKVAEHLFTQGVPSINGRGQCVYRGQNGTSCAVGVLIPDEDYRPSMDETPINSTTLLGRFRSLAWLKPHAGLLGSLQRLHDDITLQNGPLYRHVIPELNPSPPPFDRKALAGHLHYVANSYRISGAIVDRMLALHPQTESVTAD